MFHIIGWVFYGMLVGTVAKFLHPGKDNMGCLSTIAIGIAGSFVGGFANWLIGNGTSPFSSSGIIMGVLGTTILCYSFGWFAQNKTTQNPPT